MRLTWKDAVTTLFVAAIVAIYVTFLNGTSLWLISSARGTTAAVLVLGFVGGCALSALDDVRATAQPRWAQVLSAIASTLGVVALAAAVIGLITGSTVALAVLVTATIALWLIATVRHAFTVRRELVSGPDVHEVIHPENAAGR
ncbi:MAG: hypothetical protein ABSF03_25855 [Streptosporangiaceae bacterium]|jgi:hypothetical protein